MFVNRNATRLVTALAMAAVACLVAPVAATAQPAPAPSVASIINGADVVDNVPLAAVASLAPALIGAAAQAGIDDPRSAIITQVTNLLHDADLPADIAAQFQSIVDFVQGRSGDSAGIPDNVPVISNFIWPTISLGCLPGGNSVGTAVSVPGPAVLPPPGVPAHQAGFVFTALGTPGLADAQVRPLTVQWLNVLNGRTGVLPLTGAGNINPNGPSTLSAVADTGTGPVLAVVSGSVTTQAGDEIRVCDFLPTIGMVFVR